ncbi:MAG: hypothetical protein ABJB66_12575 [Gemmatimonadaceae bacterium]
MKIFRIAVACALTISSAQSLHAQGAYAGTWTVDSWKPAPWLSAADARTVKPSTPLQGRTITFTKAKIVAPQPIACSNPKYEIKSVAFDQLFEGGLRKPATEAPALGFKAPVKTLMPGCDMEFHSIDASTVKFALDNVIYTMTRKPAAAK